MQISHTTIHLQSTNESATSESFTGLKKTRVRTQLLPRSAVRTTYWYQVFHYLKWIYSCLQ